MFRLLDDSSAFEAAVVEQVTRALRTALAVRREAVLVVPGGRTPAGCFDLLARQPLEWSRVTVTLGDERWVTPGSPDSNEHLVRRHLLQQHAAQARFIPLLHPAPDAERGADLAWQALQSLPHPFDIVLLGMGEDGHIASLFPGEPATARALDPDGAPACIAVRAPVEPRQRLSLNLAALLDAREIVLLTQGLRKWTLLQRQRTADVETALPVRALLQQTKVPLTVYGSS